jgi:predicted nucleotide-binding protein (sugar kinase/HSP70/actin superfamily)
MVELFSYKSSERVFAIRKKCGEVYEFIYFDKRKAKREEEKRERKIRKALDEKEALTKKIRKKGAKVLRRLIKRKKVTKVIK